MNKSEWGGVKKHCDVQDKRMRCAALQYANGQAKECDGLNETLHSFPNVFRVSFIYVKDTISHTAYEKSIPQIADIAIYVFLFIYKDRLNIYKDCLNDKYKKIGVKPQNREPYTYFIL